jgi:CBS domain-containing protein
MKVSDVMTTTVQTCRPSTDLAAAAGVFWKGDCGVIPVADDGGKLLGIVTDRDVCIALGTRNERASEATVGEVMTRDVKTCKPEDDVRTVLETMARAKVRRLPVVADGGVLRGIVSLNDLLLRAAPPGSLKGRDLSLLDVAETLRSVSEHRSTPPARVPEPHPEPAPTPAPAAVGARR